MDSNEDKKTLKMKLIGMSPALGFNLMDDAFHSTTYLRNDWRSYVPLELAALWKELNGCERHVIALTAYAQTPYMLREKERKQESTPME